MSTAENASVPDLSVVICTRNRPDSVRRALESIRAQQLGGLRLEILVIDDGSEPPIGNMGGDVRQIRHEVSRNYISSRNEGTREARADLVMHFDDDVELTDPTVIRRAVDLMREHPECGVVAFRQVMPDGSIPDMQPLPVDRLSYSSFFFGYAFLLRTKPFRELGGLYEYFEFYLEENEYSLRLFGAGFRVLYDPSLMVVHHQDPRGRRDHRRTSRLLARNSLWMAIRHFPAWILPAASTKVLFNHVRRCHAQGGSDWLGLTWIMGQTARALPRLLKERRPMPYASIAAWRRHRLKPTPLEDAGTAAAAVGHSA